jgi:hypothetical protein
MALRTSYAAVAEIVEVDSDVSSTLQAFMDTANGLVDRMVSDAKDNKGNAFWNDTSDATLLELIERWLAAHFYRVRDPGFRVEISATSQTTIISKIDLGFSLTHEGQQAMMLDVSGWLADLNRSAQGKGAKLDVQWLGTGVDNQPKKGTLSGY